MSAQSMSALVIVTLPHKLWQ